MRYENINNSDVIFRSYCYLIKKNLYFRIDMFCGCVFFCFICINMWCICLIKIYNNLKFNIF